MKDAKPVQARSVGGGILSKTVWLAAYFGTLVLIAVGVLGAMLATVNLGLYLNGSEGAARTWEHGLFGVVLMGIVLGIVHATNMAVLQPLTSRIRPMSPARPLATLWDREVDGA